MEATDDEILASAETPLLLSDNIRENVETGLAEEDRVKDQVATDIAVFSIAGGHDVMALNFDLAAEQRQSGRPSFTKDLYVGRQVAGAVDFQIDGLGRILVAVEQLDPQLQDRVNTSGDRQDRPLTLDELRIAGLDLRYDPLRDAFVLND